MQSFNEKYCTNRNCNQLGKEYYEVPYIKAVIIILIISFIQNSFAYYFSVSYMAYAPLLVSNYILSLIKIPPPPDVFVFFPSLSPYIALITGAIIWFIFFGIKTYYLWNRTGIYCIFNFLELINTIPIYAIYFVNTMIPYPVLIVLAHFFLNMPFQAKLQKT